MIARPFFDKPVSQLDFLDVRRFLERRVREGYRLDYKRAVSSKLIDTACAFANSSGGYIILGVSDKADDMPDLDALPGVDARQLRSATDMILGNRAPDFRFDWNETLDDTIERFALERGVVERGAQLIPRASGVAIGRPGEINYRQRVEVGDDGLIACAHLLAPRPIAGSPDVNAVALEDVLVSFFRMLRFAADAYRAVGGAYVDEAEVWLSMQGFYGTRLRLAGRPADREVAGPMPQSLAIPQIVSYKEYVRLGTHGDYSIHGSTFLST